MDKIQVEYRAVYARQDISRYAIDAERFLDKKEATQFIKKGKGEYELQVVCLTLTEDNNYSGFFGYGKTKAEAMKSLKENMY